MGVSPSSPGLQLETGCLQGIDALAKSGFLPCKCLLQLFSSLFILPPFPLLPLPSKERRCGNPIPFPPFFVVIPHLCPTARGWWDIQRARSQGWGFFSRALNPASLAPQQLGERSSLPHHQCCPFSFASTQTTSCISSEMPQHPGDTNATFPVIPGGKKNPEKFTLIFFFFF